MFKKRSKKYISNIDTFLAQLRAQGETASQQQERQHYAVLAQLRDNAASNQDDDSIWENF